MHSTSKIGDLIGKIYEAPAHALGWRSIIEPLEEALNGNVAIFAHRISSVSTIAFCTSCNLEMAAEYERSLWVDDLAMGHVRNATVGQPILDSGLIGDKQRLKSSFYNDYLGAVGCDRGLYFPFLQSGGEIFLVSAQRSARCGDFEDEIDLVGMLGPHMARSFLTWRRLKALEEEKAIALLGMKQAGLGMLIVNRRGAVLFCNEMAEAKLRTDVLCVTNGRIRGRTGLDHANLRNAIERVIDGECGQSHTLRLTSSYGANFHLTVAPVRSDISLANPEPLAMLLLDRWEPKRIDERLLVDHYGATRAELRLLKALVAGERLSSYACRHGIALTTAKTHLSSLFDKTGQRRQSDLIRFALDAATSACG